MPDEMIRTAGALPLPQHAALPTRGLPTALPINLSALMSAAGESIHVLDARGRVVWGNAQALHERSAAGMPDLGWRWERGWPAARRGAIHEAIDLARSSGSAHVTMRDPGRMDGEHDRLVTLARIAVPEDAGEYMIAISRDVDHGVAPVENGHRRGAVDGLTGLPDAGYFHRELARRVADGQCLEHPFALVIMDFDDFKQINYRVGLERSDTMLVAFADRMEQAAGDAGFLARSSGDEFLLMLDTADRDTGTEGGVPIHNRVAAMVRQVISRISQAEVSSDLSASLGIAMFPRDTVDAQDLTRFAYTALRAAKASGKGRCVRFNGDMRQQMQNQLSMLEMARVAIASDWLRPYYQPKVDLHSGALVGFEALLRWKSPDGVVHFPASIAAAFDDPDIAAHISDLMLEKVLADMTVWQRTESALPVAINASSADFRDRGFAGQFLARIAAAGLRPDLFELEVTEGVFIGAGASDVGVALQHLNAAGVRIALDDFGTGYAALSHLKQHPVDVIKIDRSFISNVTASPDDRAIVGAMASLSRNLAIEVVAEGVETAEQVSLLRELGCQTGQGFLFGQAVPGAEVPDLLRRHCVDYPMSGTS